MLSCTRDVPRKPTVFSTVPVAQVHTLPSKAKRTQINDNVATTYNGEKSLFSGIA